LPPADDKAPRKRPTPRKRATPRKSTAPRKRAAPPSRSVRPSIDDAAVETNGHADWPDYSAETASWDPWDEGEGAPEGGGEGLNRTLGEWLEAVVPPEAQLHFYNAGREFAAGVQTTFEHHLRRGDDDDDGPEAVRIEIE
jgi:hypothetical protein